jgi:two-component system, OmpR family, KDP operon response regulator KdpE
MAARILVLAAGDSGQPLCSALEELGYTVSHAGDLPEAARMILREPPDALVAMLSNSSAAQACELLRSLGDFRILVVPEPIGAETARACLDEGADMVLLNPVGNEELLERLRAVLRRPGVVASQAIRFGDFVLDVNAHTLSRDGATIDLTPTEFRLLSVLAENAGRVVTNAELLTRVWGDEYADDVQYVRLYIGYLRAKLEDDPASPRWIVTHRAIGYRLAVEEDDATGAQVTG